MRRSLVAVVMPVVLTPVAACGSGEPAVSPGELFGEYARSTDVRNDRFPGAGGSSEDRLANLASIGTPDQLAGSLLRTFACGESAVANRAPANRCELTGSLTRAATDFAGPGAQPLGRSLLVERADGELELLTVYVVQRADGEARLIDRDGGTYTGLDDFRAGNELLDHDDTVLTLRDVTSVPGEGELVVVSGHTPPVWQWWLAGSAALLALAGAGTAVARRVRAARHPDPLLTPLEFDGD